MNIDKVNATLSKALVHIQQTESEDLRESIAKGAATEEPADFISGYVESLTNATAEAAGAKRSVAEVAVIEAMEALSAKQPVTVKTIDDLTAWAGKVGLADEIARRLT
jgi:hypothetical protein